MTLSVCIPIYNYNVTKLIRDLASQADSAGLSYEILLMDDGSSSHKEENRQLTSLTHVTYTELPHNIGRSAIRNQLAAVAQYEFLLFMDCDTEVYDENFIQRYIDAATQQKADVILGGCCYKEGPQSKEMFLRWFYGKAREERSAEIRNQNPYRSFSAFNCLIRKEIFDIVNFDNTLTQYGHEDTLFGWELKKKHIPFLHIDNPAYHLSYDDTDSFIIKTNSSMHNLWVIYDKIEEKEEFREDIKILKYQDWLKKHHLISPFVFSFGLMKKLLIFNLKSSAPSLFVYDLYKLGILCTESMVVK